MPEDDDIRAAFSGHSTWAEERTRLPGPEHARRRARTRSTVALAGAAVLTAVAVGAAVVGVGLPGPPDPAPAAPPPPPTGVPTTVPDDLDLGFEPLTDPDFRLSSLPTLPTGICGDEALPGIDAATDQLVQQVTGPEYGDARGLAVFPDADAAVAFMTGLQAEAASCATGVPLAVGGTREVVQEPLPGPWATGLTIWLFNVPYPGGDPQPVVGSHLYVARVGSAVAMAFRTGEYLVFDRPYTIDPGTVALDRVALDTLRPQMCRWTVEGC